MAYERVKGLGQDANDLDWGINAGFALPTVDQYTPATVDPGVSMAPGTDLSSTPGSAAMAAPASSSNWWDTIVGAVTSGAKVVSAAAPTVKSLLGTPAPVTPPPVTAPSFSATTLLLIGGVGLGAFLLMRRK